MRQTRSRQHDRKCRLKSSHVKSIYFNHSSQGNSADYYIILGPKDKAAPPTSQQINKFPPKRANHLALPSSISPLPFIPIHRRALRSQPIRGKVRRIGRIFLEHVERSFLDPEYRFVAVCNYIREANVHPIKNHLYSPNTPNYVREQMFTRLRRRLTPYH